MMSNEEWERKMEFLLNQQAKFDIEMTRIEEAQAATGKKLDRAAEMLSSYTNILFEHIKLTNVEIQELRDSQKLTDKQLRESQEFTYEQIHELSEAQKLTDEQLRKFIPKVDRLTGETQNGSLN